MNRSLETCAPLRFWHLTILFGLALALRLLSMPDHNLAEDPFTLIEAAKYLLKTGVYRMPGVGSPDAVLQYTLPSWPVGFPLALAGAFAIFGTHEIVARGFTAALSSLVAPLTAGTTNLIIRDRHVALVAGLLAAIHPLSVAFGGQVFTNNLSVTLFIASLYFLAKCLAGGDAKGFVPLREVGRTPRRQWHLALPFFIFGLMLSTRDTDIVFIPIWMYLIFLGEVGLWRQGEGDFTAWRKCLWIGLGALLIGWAPSLYFNMVNFGFPLVSTHYETGIRLSLDYLVRGSDAFFGLPGIAVMGATILVYYFPAFAALPLVRRGWSTVSPFAVMGVLCALPLLLINGAFPVASTGAAPRYVLPLVPFASAIIAYTLYVSWREKKRWPMWLFFSVAIGWQSLLTYPPVRLFAVWPGFAYLTYYSPVYIGHPYHHYPDHTNAMVQWVREHTPTEALIVTPSRAQHFFYYGKRDVVVLNALTAARWSTFVSERPVYLVEDKYIAARPAVIESLSRELREEKIVLNLAGVVKIFSPEKGDISLRVYRAMKVRTDGNTP